MAARVPREEHVGRGRGLRSSPSTEQSFFSVQSAFVTGVVRRSVAGGPSANSVTAGGRKQIMFFDIFQGFLSGPTCTNYVLNVLEISHQARSGLKKKLLWSAAAAQTAAIPQDSCRAVVILS